MDFLITCFYQGFQAERNSLIFTFASFRSADYDPSKENLGGRNFGLFAFVTDVDDDVIVGSDGIEHV